MYRTQEKTAEYEFSIHFKRKMNRVFREQVGLLDKIPHPEADNLFEKYRSTMIYYLRRLFRCIS